MYRCDGRTDGRCSMWLVSVIVFVCGIHLTEIKHSHRILLNTQVSKFSLAKWWIQSGSWCRCVFR